MAVKCDVAKVIAQLKDIQKPGKLYIFLLVALLIWKTPEIIAAITALVDTGVLECS